MHNTLFNFTFIVAQTEINHGENKHLQKELR